MQFDEFHRREFPALLAVRRRDRSRHVRGKASGCGASSQQ